MCPAFVFIPSSLPKSHHHPSLFLFFSPLSLGRLDYVAKEIFLSFFFSPFFTVSHWFGVNAFWMPLGVCRTLGEEESPGSCWVEEFQSEALRWGSVWVRAQREALKWELKWFPEPRNLFAPPLPPLSFSGSLLHRQSTGALPVFPFHIQKPNPWAKQTYYFP